MAIASGSRVKIAYIEEVTRGTTPGSPTLQTLRVTQRNINPTKATLGSEEVRSDRQIADLRHGFRRVEGSLGFELSMTAFDDMLEGALAGDWAAGVGTGAVQIDVDSSAKTFTRASGSFLTDGFKKGDIIDGTAFANAGNNGQFRITALTAKVATVADPDGALVTETGGGDEELDVVGNKLNMGTTLKTYTFERQFTDLTQYQVFRGVAINTMNLNIRPEAIVGGNFGLVGMSFAGPTGTSLDSTPTAAATNSPFSAFDGELYEGGSAIAIVTGLELTINNNRELVAVVGSPTSPDVFEGNGIVTGTMTALFEDAALINKFINETESSIYLKLDDLNGTDWMNLVIPRLKYTGAPIDPPQQGPVVISLPFQALVDTSSNGTASTIFLQRSTA